MQGTPAGIDWGEYDVILEHPSNVLDIIHGRSRVIRDVVVLIEHPDPSHRDTYMSGFVRGSDRDSLLIRTSLGEDVYRRRDCPEEDAIIFLFTKKVRFDLCCS
jgi:hypothetical protein